MSIEREAEIQVVTFQLFGVPLKMTSENRPFRQLAQPLRRGSHVAQTLRLPFRRQEPKNGGFVPLGPTAPRSESRVRAEPPRRVAWGGVATARSRLPGCGNDAGPWSWSGDSGKRRRPGERRPGTPPRVPASVPSGVGPRTPLPLAVGGEADPAQETPPLPLRRGRPQRMNEEARAAGEARAWSAALRGGQALEKRTVSAQGAGSGRGCAGPDLVA
ncbi:hypothetical protein H8959_022437 [Pygathrix nigripes]